MLTHEDLPREHGVPVGKYHLTHSQPGYRLDGFAFENGRTVEPLTGRRLLRLLMSHGGEFVLAPADEDTALAVLAHLEHREAHERLAEVKAYCDALFPASSAPSDGAAQASDESAQAAASAKDGDPSSDVAAASTPKPKDKGKK